MGRTAGEDDVAMTQAPDPLSSGSQRANGTHAPAQGPGDPGGAGEPTSTNAVYPASAPWPPDWRHPAGIHPDGTDLPGGERRHQFGNDPLPDNQNPTMGHPVTGSANPGNPWLGGPRADPHFGAAPGYVSAPGYAPAPGYVPLRWRQRPARPGSATAAGVLGIVYGCLLLAAALVMWAIPYLLAEGGAFSTTELQSLALELWVVSTFTATSGVVLVVGGILIFRGDRSALIFGAVATLLLSTYWLVRMELEPQFPAWPLISAIVPVIILVQCAGRSVVSWIRWRPL